MTTRYLGIDMGVETVKVVELAREGDALRTVRRARLPHDKDPQRVLLSLLAHWAWDGIAGAAVCGRYGRLLALPRVPQQQALARGFRHLYDDWPATLISIGGRGFSVLELRESGTDVYRENSRCAQGTGNFLRQLVQRFGLDVDGASELCSGVADPAPLSGRCPVILKTDMTHLANKGEDRARILAGLYDAISDSVQALVKPRVCPPRLVLTGGVCRAERIRTHFRAYAHRHGLEFVDACAGEDGLYLEATGAAVLAVEIQSAVPTLTELATTESSRELEFRPPLAASLGQVRRLTPPEPVPIPPDATAVVGLDIGSTGAKAVVLEPVTGSTIWQDYLPTGGDPIRAAQNLMRRLGEGAAGNGAISGFGVTGSGREVVSSLLITCYGSERVFVLNEIAAHAAGACAFEPAVDTIFEIGGQDAKYIRLEDGRVVDAAMNEACSAGTGSFIEEQGKRFPGAPDVVELGIRAVEATRSVALGQHCSVFMAELIDEAMAAGADPSEVIAGLYDSVVQNYLNRVKARRGVGQVILCQGKPFAADALAAAVARQTGSEVVIPPDPGTVGALGIALLASKEVAGPPLDPRRFLAARLARKDAFVCSSKDGCGGAGNNCRIDRIFAELGGSRQRLTWGGACSQWQGGVGGPGLPDGAPDPFRHRAERIAALIAERGEKTGRPRVALADAFHLKALFPFFATLISELGFDLEVPTEVGREDLRRGIEGTNVPFCAPMQQFHGVVSRLAEADPDYVFLPMIRGTPRSAEEEHAVVCPIVQGSADVIRHDLKPDAVVLNPTIDFGVENLASKEFFASCERLARDLGANREALQRAYSAARAVQEEFDSDLFAVGAAALTWCADNDVQPIVVHGRPYTIHDTLLNANVPALLREQGALPIPIDSFPPDDLMPVFEDIYCGYGQRNLRAAWRVRRTEGLYSLWCSNYSCGPDTFNIHFYAHFMDGKPYAVIETDGHTGDAGTKTRIEAFLHCVREDLERDQRPPPVEALPRGDADLPTMRDRDETILIPRMGPGSETFAAILRTVGFTSEALDPPDRASIALGLRHTTGKECVPMSVTLGSLLRRLEADRDTDRRFAYFMPTTNGPCRFGDYHLLHAMVLERTGWSERARIWAPTTAGYFDGVAKGFATLFLVSQVSADLLLDAVLDVRPVESIPGEANRIYERYQAELVRHLESLDPGQITTAASLLQVATGRMFGCSDLLLRAAREFATIKTAGDPPVVLVVGESYVRCNPTVNDHTIQKLERLGMRVRFAPFAEWLEYVDYLSRSSHSATFKAQLKGHVQQRIHSSCYRQMAAVLGWPERTTVDQSVRAAAGYLTEDLAGEAILTVGGSVHEWRAGHIDGVVNIGPLECMPSKIAEAQLFHVGENEGLPSVTLPVDGGPIDSEILESFAFAVRESRIRKSRPEQGQQAGDHDRHRA